MSRKSLYSVHNALPSRRPRAPQLELNPAVVVADGRRDFLLSLVVVGRRLCDDGAPAPLSVSCDGETVELEAIHLRQEPAGGGRWLTVALYPVTRGLLDRLAACARVEVGLGNGRRRVRRGLGKENRGNVVAFLGRVDREVSPADRTPRPGERDSDAPPAVTSVAV